ncbi:hypothetical protein WG904_14380 [Pedobacter sp. Du54]
MTDPKEKPQQQQDEEKKIKEPTRGDGTNWEENHRIDEEGNELDPEDIK